MSDTLLGMRHQWISTWRTSRGFAIGAIAASIAMHGLAILVAAVHGSLPDNLLTSETVLPLAVGLWSALALLPALGGGESDDPLALAAAGAGKSFRFGARLSGSLTDAGPGFFIPALAIVGAAAAGWPGWLAGLSLAWNGVAAGQLSGALAAQLVRRIGATTALLAMAALILITATVLATSGIGPGAWWLFATAQPAYDLLLLGSGVLALVAARWLNRPAEVVVRPARPLAVPRSTLGAVTLAMWVGVSRSIMARSTLITAVLAPLLVRSSGQLVTQTIAFFVTAAAAAIVGANGFAYDGGAPVWLLGKASHGTLLVGRLVTTGLWALVLAVVAAISSALVGARMTWAMAPSLLLVVVAAAAAGLVPSVHRPTPTDYNSFRSQPAPVASAVGTLARAMALTTVVIMCPLPIAAVVVGCYTAFALLHAYRSMRDPVPLAALT